MKQFFTTLAAVFVGGFIALLCYDHFIVKPREAKMAATAASPLQVDQDPPDLAKTREEARQVAEEVDASVQRSVKTARDAMQAQANEIDRRALIGSAVSRATMFRVAVTEYYQTNGTWPRSADDAGLPSAEEMRGSGVAGIALAERGAVVVTLDASLAEGSKILLRPELKAGGGMIDWRCEIEGDAALKPLLPNCVMTK
jgi:maltoporin